MLEKSINSNENFENGHENSNGFLICLQNISKISEIPVKFEIFWITLMKVIELEDLAKP